MSQQQSNLKFKHTEFKDLFNPEWLQAFDQQFLDFLNSQNQAVYYDLIAYRHQRHDFTPQEISALLIACGPWVEEFITEFFDIQHAAAAASAFTLSQQPVFVFKNWYVLKQARRRLQKQEQLPPFHELDQWLEGTLKAEAIDADKELATALLGQKYLEDETTFAVQIEKLTQWCITALTDPKGKQAVKDWVSFHLPKKLDYQQLVPMQKLPEDKLSRWQGPPEHFRQRDGFKLTDHRMTPRQVLDEIDYCVYCHKTDGDFCSKGFPVKKTEPEKGLKTNPLGEIQTGCPLEEKISEMHVLKRDGYTIAALAMIMVDNPMCPATGHRICNDCMKACIYQKQDPVNIPQTETGILTDVLALPWGVEIYDLLTRWNPMRRNQWVAKPYNGFKILIAGMGPAGFSLAHHLLMEGCAVVGTDGLKIEPLPSRFINQPIHDFTDIKEDLDSRVLAGFGGVAEYGITVRWDKNFLKLIYISLMRRPFFEVYGGVRFGGSVTVEDAWRLGFDHLAVAVGAGLPQALPIPGSMAPGMRQANDFLMALQLTGAAKKNSLTNLQVRLPAVVIGGGLTGVDTATEVQAYYITQVEKTLARYETLSKVLGEARLRQQFDDASFQILNEFINHGLLVRKEREVAATENRAPDFLKLIRSWGGVTIVYRKLLRDSPAYLRNHEEVIKAFEEGIYYAENLTPTAARLDQYGHVESLLCQYHDKSGIAEAQVEERELPARAIFVATGAKPNIAYEFEHRGTFHREGPGYLPFDSNGKLMPVLEHGHVKTEHFGAFTSYNKDDYRVSFLGDTHPVFHGSVVKAIASGKRVYPKIMQVLQKKTRSDLDLRDYQNFAAMVQHQFTAIVKKITRHTPSVVELQVQAPLAAQNFAAGQFFRVQNFETLAKQVNGTLLQTEATALLGTKVDKEKGLISLLILEEGVSTRLFALLKENEPLSLMGPTGFRTKIPQDQETILVIGGRMSAARLLSFGAEMRAAGNRVLFIMGLKTRDELFCQEELELAADKIIWVTHFGEPVNTNRPQDRAITCDLFSALTQYARGALDNGEPEIPFQSVNRVLLIGKKQFLHQMRTAFDSVLKEYFIKNPSVIASVYGPMQCMLKGVCAQCLVWQIDPQTGKRTKAVFSCSWQDQPFEIIDIHNLDERLEQNRAQEILGNLWLDYIFSHYQISVA
jgi:NADPH-dependent glutamate synthase beta subunit-like oxidoreductase/NAD(P)H-flavin reductase